MNQSGSERAVNTGFQGRNQVAFNSRQNHLGLRIPETTVEFKRLGSRFGHHQTGIEHALVVDSAILQLRERSSEYFPLDDRHQFGRENRGGRIRTHATRVGTLIVVEGPLVILGAGQQHHMNAIGQGQHGHFLALEKFFNKNAPTGIAEGTLHQGLMNRPLGLLQRGAHGNALPGRKPLGLDHDGRSDIMDEVYGFRGIRKGAGLGGGHSCRHHDILGKNLAPLHPGSLFRGTKHTQALFFKKIREAGAKWSLGSHHSQIGSVFTRPGHDAPHILRADIQIRRQLRRSGITGRTEDLRLAAVMNQLPNQGVFPPPSANH